MVRAMLRPPRMLHQSVHSILFVAADPLVGSLPRDAESLTELGTAVVVQPEVFARAEKVYTPGHQAADADFLNRINDTAYTFSFDVAHITLVKPTFILTGRRANSVGFQNAMKLSGRFKRATFATLDAAGHSLPLGQDLVFESMLREWLERLTAYESDMQLTSA